LVAATEKLLMSKARNSVVFDLGGVLIDWNPRYLYRKLFNGNESEMERFLATVCTSSWNEHQDAGRPFAEGCALLRTAYPSHGKLIDAWLLRYEEMLGGAIEGTVAVLGELRSRQVPIYALSNWSAETFPVALKRFEFLQWFQGIVISGDAKLVKPDPRIFQHFLSRFGMDPVEAVYIDDNLPNVEVAAALGMHGIRFRDPSHLRRELLGLGLLADKRQAPG
jgi:2-haloacid dehalogenase